LEPAHTPEGSLSQTSQAAPPSRRTFTTPFGEREFTKGDYNALDYGLRWLVTSKSHPQWWRYKDDQTA
jgi:hypothetical protein